eukprot:c21702_g1_i2 orf=508-1317(-)
MLVIAKVYLLCLPNPLMEKWVVTQGSLEDTASLEAAIKQVDVVISAVGGKQVIDQLKLVTAIKEVGTVKRFLPSEFGLDVDRDLRHECVKMAFRDKVKVRRAIEEAGIPYTYVSSNSFAGSFLANLGEVGILAPPTEEVTIFGDGNAKAVFVAEEDIGTYAVKTVDDQRAENKTVYIRPAANIVSQREVVAMWEEKTGRALEKIELSEEKLLKAIQETPFPRNIMLALRHIIFVRGDQVFEIGPGGMDATKLYPDVEYVTADKFLDRFI